MKTFLKLIILFTAFGFAMANAAYTEAEKTAAIKAVTDAIATGNEDTIKAAVNAQIAAFPELAGDIVSAALKITGGSENLQKIIVKVAAFTAPNQIVSITNAINGISGISVDFKSAQQSSASTSAASGTAILAAANNTSSTVKSLVSFN